MGYCYYLQVFSLLLLIKLPDWQLSGTETEAVLRCLLPASLRPNFHHNHDNSLCAASSEHTSHLFVPLLHLCTVRSVLGIEILHRWPKLNSRSGKHRTNCTGSWAATTIVPMKWETVRAASGEDKVQPVARLVNGVRGDGERSKEERERKQIQLLCLDVKRVQQCRLAWSTSQLARNRRESMRID